MSTNVSSIPINSYHSQNNLSAQHSTQTPVGFDKEYVEDSSHTQPAPGPNTLILPLPNQNPPHVHHSNIRSLSYFLLQTAATAACTVVASHACLAAATPPMLQIGLCSAAALLGAFAVKVMEKSPQLQAFEIVCRNKVAQFSNTTKYTAIVIGGLTGIGVLAQYSTQIQAFTTLAPLAHGCSMGLAGFLLGASTVCLPQHAFFSGIGSYLAYQYGLPFTTQPVDRCVAVLAGVVCGFFVSKNIESINNALQTVASSFSATAIVLAAILTYNPSFVHQLQPWIRF